MKEENGFGFQYLVALCKRTHQEMQRRTVRSIDTYLVIRNWLFGWYIVEYEQKGTDRAEYAAYLIKRLSDELGKQLGRGFSMRSLEQCRKFYMTRKQIPQTASAEFFATDSVPLKKDLNLIPQAVSALLGDAEPKEIDWRDITTRLIKQFPLGWSHYVTLLTVENPNERRFYEIEAVQNQWSVRELERQIASSLYERLALSRNPDEIRSLAEQGLVIEKAADLIKNPLVLEFLNLVGEEAKLKERIKDAEAKLDAQVYAHYPSLTEDEIKTLVVDDKWFSALDTAIHREMDRVSKGLTQLVKDLAERYENPLPNLTKRVADLEAKVNRHLGRIGFAWN